MNENLKKTNKKNSFKKSGVKITISKTEQNKKRKKSSKKCNLDAPRNLISHAESYGCSTLSTRATTETSSNTSSTSTPGSTKSSNVTQQNDSFLPINKSNNYDANHYQKLFLRNNSFRQNDPNQGLNYSHSNVNNTYVPNKVALLCNTDTNMPQLIKVMDIKELNNYVQLLNSGD